MKKQILIATRIVDDITNWENALSAPKFAELRDRIMLHVGEFGRLGKEVADSVKVVIGGLIFEHSNFNTEYNQFANINTEAIIFTTMTQDRHLGSHGVNGAIVVSKNPENMVRLLELLLVSNLDEEKDRVYLRFQLQKEFKEIRW